jgi:hypothetical protein
VKLQREAALKAIRPELAHDRKWRDRFQQEALAAASLRVHENVAVVYAFSEIEPDAEREAFDDDETPPPPSDPTPPRGP